MSEDPRQIDPTQIDSIEDIKEKQEAIADYLAKAIDQLMTPIKSISEYDIKIKPEELQTIYKTMITITVKDKKNKRKRP